MMPPSISTRLAGQHFAAATLYLLAGALGLVWIAPELARGDFLSPHVAGVTHLFTLGWLTTTIFGALFQLLPVALGAPLRWPRLGDVSFWTFAPGAGLFACGVADGSVMLHHAGLALVATGITLVIVNVGATLPHARKRDVTWAAIVTALGYLLSTFALGVVLLHNIHTGFIAEARVRVLATHLHVALIGWAMIMIVGVSHRLLPMFLLAHGAKSSWTKRALILLAAGVLVLAAGINLQVRAVSWVAVLLLEAGLACFLYQARSFYLVRVRRNVGAAMRFAGAAAFFFAIAAILGPVLLWRGAASTQLATAYVLTALLGGIVMYVIGFFYKIVPMLAWTARYAGRGSQPGVPTVAEMYSERAAASQLVLMTSAVGLLIVAILTGSSAGVRTGAVAFFAGTLVFVAQIVRVALGGRFRRTAEPVALHAH